MKEMKESEQILLANLTRIKGRWLKYNQLCKELNLKIKSGNSKISQLNDLQIYCQLNKQENPTKYIVEETYGEILTGLGILNNNNKYQLLFEAAIYKAFLDNDGNSLYVSNMEMLKLFQEVNENFSYACNSEHMMKMGKEFVYMTEMSQTVYKILRQWTKRRIDCMVNRDIIILTKGFRLYTQYHNKYGTYKISHNVRHDSRERQICQEIFEQAITETMPKDWVDQWVPNWRWVQYEKRIIELTKEKFNNEYCDLRHINILSPPTKEWIQKRLEETYNQIKDLTGINKEVCKKIMGTKQLNGNTQQEKEKFIETNIISNPAIIFKEKIKEKNNEKQ